MWPDGIDKGDDEALVPIGERPEDIRVTVAGGAVKHSDYIPTFSNNKSVTRRIDNADFQNAPRMESPGSMAVMDSITPMGAEYPELPGPNIGEISYTFTNI